MAHGAACLQASQQAVWPTSAQAPSRAALLRCCMFSAAQALCNLALCIFMRNSDCTLPACFAFNFNCVHSAPCHTLTLLSCCAQVCTGRPRQVDRQNEAG